MDLRMHTVETAAGRIGYREAGDGADTLVLLHGLGGGSPSWEAQLETLSRSRRVVAWDCPGYGGSADLGADDPGPDDYVASLVAFLDAMAISACDLLGHSMGGIVAARFAAKHPDRVRRLVLSCTSADFSPSGPGFASRIEDLRTLPAAEFGRLRAEGMAAAGTPPEVRARLAAIAGAVRLPGFAAAARMLGRSDNRALLGELSLPVLVIAGREDRIAPVAEAERLAAAIAGAAIAVIEGAGHAPYAERSAAYDNVLLKFLDGR